MHPEVLPCQLYSTKSFPHSLTKCSVGGSVPTPHTSLVSEGEKVNTISDHLPVYKKPVSDKEFGSYLAGLIEGDGNINKKVINITIAFHYLDASLAYYIKKRIGYGVVVKIKDKNAYLYRANLKGSIVIAKLINGKLRTDKIQNFNCLLELINKRIPTPIIPQVKDISLLTDSYWLAGFSDADGSFQVKTLNREGRKFGFEIRLNYQIGACLQKNNFVLGACLQIREVFGGSVGYRKSQDTFYYSSVSFGSAKKVINYFDHFNLLSSKHINFIKWRNVYRLIQREEHLTKNGINKILKIKSSMIPYVMDKILAGEPVKNKISSTLTTTTNEDINRGQSRSLSLFCKIQTFNVASKVKTGSFAVKKGTYSKNYSTNAKSPLVPVKVYSNSDILKIEILRENKGKSGVYRWINLETGESYVGSSKYLGKRFRVYYSLISLENI